MSVQGESAAAQRSFSMDEWRALRALRTRYQRTGDLLTDSELARLRFWRWLYRTGKIIP
jgi:hypothetical protein